MYVGDLFDDDRQDGLRQSLAWQDEEERQAAASSDLFCCLQCGSLWLLSHVPGDDGPTVVAVSGKRCTECRDQPPHLDFSERVGDPPPPVDIHLPELDRAARSDLGVRFVAKAVRNGGDAAVADTAAAYARRMAREWIDQVAPPADSDCAFTMIADGLERIPRGIRTGVAWVAREVIGTPRFYAEVLGHLASGLADPLRLNTLATGVRIAGTVHSAAEGELLRSRVARDLAGEWFEDALRKALLEPPEPPEPEPPALPGPGDGL